MDIIGIFGWNRRIDLWVEDSLKICIDFFILLPWLRTLEEKFEQMDGRMDVQLTTHFQHYVLWSAKKCYFLMMIIKKETETVRIFFLYKVQASAWISFYMDFIHSEVNLLSLIVWVWINKQLANEACDYDN